MELIQLTKEIYDVSQRLDKSSRTLYNLAKDKADAERTYRIKLAQKIMEIRESGQPASLVADLARGHEEVANLKYDRDLAEGIYKSAIESKRSIESQLSALQTITRYQTEV